MKLYLLLILVLTFTFTSFGQTKAQTDAPYKTKNIVINMNDGETSSEMLPIMIGFGKGLTSAKFGAKYFGPQSESGISIILLLAGTGKTYQPQTDYGLEFIIDDINLNKGKFRLVNKLDNDEGYRVLQFIISTEEFAWMISGDKLQLNVYNLEEKKMLHYVTITPSMMRELKAFGKSVILIRSHFTDSEK